MENKDFFIKLKFFIFLVLSFCVHPVMASSPIVYGDSPVLKRIISNGIIRVGVNPLFKPFSFVDKKGERVGIDIDIAKLLANKLGVKLKIVVPPSFSDLIPMVQRGDIDIIIAAMSRVFERAKVIDFTNSYYDTGISIMLNRVKGSELEISQVTSYRELMEQLKRIGKKDQLIIAATENKAPIKTIPIFFPGAKIKIYPTNEEAAEAVARGEAHIMVHDEIFLKRWVLDHPKRSLYRLFVFSKPYKKDTYGFGIAKGNQSFLNLLNMFIYDYLYTRGYFKQFMDKYMKGG